MGTQAVAIGDRDRRAVTVIAWIPAHRGDPGNDSEGADYLAGVGRFSDKVQWDRPTHPLRLFDFCNTSQRISQHGWTGGAERHARIFQGELMVARLSGSTASSTQAMLTPGRGQEMIGVAS